MSKIIELTVQLAIHQVSCPGVWLHQDGSVKLTVFALGTSYQTCLLPPAFPIMFKDVFYFKKNFQENCALNNICCLLKNETIYCELVQWSEDCISSKYVVLAQYLGNLNDVLFPPNACANEGIDLLMRRTNHFPGILSPKIEITTKVRIDEVWSHEISAPTLFKCCSCLSDNYTNKNPRQLKVCHSPMYHRHRCDSSKNDWKPHATSSKSPTRSYYSCDQKLSPRESCNTRYSDNRPPKKPTCGHNTKTYRCTELNSNDVFFFHRAFYRSNNKIEQDNFILKYVTFSKIQRRRPVTGTKSRNISTKYFITQNNTKEIVPVCKQAFLNTLNLKKGRVDGVIRRHLQTGNMAVENRGGNKKEFQFRSRREAVINYILTLQPLETHYTREKVRERQYLHSELNIKKIWKMYMDQSLPGFGVSFSFFRKIFVTKFNIGFGSPRQDVCSTCLQLTEKIKQEKNASEKVKIMTELVIHKRRAKAFYKLLQKEADHEILLSFDCQKNLPLPKIPDQSTYYSRQLYFYNCTIVRGSSRNPLCKDNIYAYTWTEETAHKGSNEICSAVIHCLNNLDTSNIETIRLMADGCGGQNKNSIILGAIMHWLYSTTSAIKRVEIIFPVTGHSFLPSDRVFALTEKQIKKKETILQPEEYIDIVQEHATVFRLGTDVPILDYKTQSKNILKSTQSFHFQITKCKRFIITIERRQVKIRGEISYYSDTGTSKSITKRGQNFSNFKPMRIPIGVPVQEAKLMDVRKLLETHFGTNWPTVEELKFYKKVLNSENQIGRPYDDPSDVEDDSEEVLNFV